MKLREDMSPEKLRGGFYTPPRLVDFCLARIAALLPGQDGLRVLEPSAGDGAFLRRLRKCDQLGTIDDVRAIEVVPEEAAKAELSLRAGNLPGEVITSSAIAWVGDPKEQFDVVVGNPPFVRYQFVSPTDKTMVARLGARLGVTFGGVSNLWIPVLLGGLSRLRPGGALAVVVPTECFTGCSAAVARDWLVREVDDLQFDLFPPGSFPGVLQEVTVVSGRRTRKATRRVEVRVVEHSRVASKRSWVQSIDEGAPNWMELLLEPDAREALNLALALPQVRPLSSLARLEVSIVTGANDFFCVSDATMRRFRLEPWARPLLPRSRYSPGLRFRRTDQDALRESGARAWLLDFGSDRPDPMASPDARRYLALGEQRQLHTRYKCRIRAPWYRIPSIRSGTLLLSKRSHLFPRLIANEADSLTTDTIYRGSFMGGEDGVGPCDLVAGFHSSLTLLTAELHGRSFGGGVLELVPSELARVAVATDRTFGAGLSALDAAARSEDPDSLIERTDGLLVARGVVPADAMSTIAEARRTLLDRRLDRNRFDRTLLADAA